MRERVVRMVAEVRIEQDSGWAAMSKVAGLLGVDTPETVRKWCQQAQVDSGARPGVSRQDSAEVKRLKWENAELKRANWRFQGVSATTWASFSEGVVYSRVLRGRLLRLRWMRRRSIALTRASSVLLGKNWRMRPLVFSFEPQHHGECGSQK